jgi:hypothetical protein
MALLVLLIPTGGDEVAIGSQAVEALTRLGVTSVSVARDELTTAVILEGWAFQPARAEHAIAALGFSRPEARALQPVAQMAVLAAFHQGGGTP